jgi:hypothetical protein
MPRLVASPCAVMEAAMEIQKAANVGLET